MHENLNVPDGLPTLSKDSHKPGDGKACVMEYVALLAGEEWTDTPKCTHPVLAHMAQLVNDKMADENRHLLVPLIGRLFGTSETDTTDGQDVEYMLGLWGQRSIRDLDTDAARWAAMAGTTTGVLHYVVWAHTSLLKFDVSCDLAVGRNKRDRLMVKFLSDLIDEYDRLTGRTERRELSGDDLLDLSSQVRESAGARR